MNRRFCGVLLAGFTVLGACDQGPEMLLSIPGTAVIIGSAFVDANTNGIQDGEDRSLPGLRVQVAYSNASDTLMSVVTGPDGQFFLDGIAVGDLRLEVDAATIPDSLVIEAVSDAQFSLGANDTARVTIRAGYPRATVAEARALPAGRRIVVEGVAVSPLAAFENGIAHIVAGGGAIRASGVPASAIAPGDSIRLVAATARDNGQPILEVDSWRVLTRVQVPAPMDVTTAEAANASGGALDAQLVRVRSATVTSVTVAEGQHRFTLDDGSGVLDAAVSTDRDFNLELLTESSRIDATGVLVPLGTGRWRLLPRTNADISER